MSKHQQRGTKNTQMAGLKFSGLSKIKSGFHLPIIIQQPMSIEYEQTRQQKKQNQPANHGPAQNSPPSSSSASSRSLSSSRNSAENGSNSEKKLVRYKECCKVCKHPDKQKRACVCVVPLSQRRTELGAGCRNCGCTGCTKEDYLSKGQDPQYHQTARLRRPQPPRKEDKRPQRRTQRSNSRKNIRSPRRVSRNSESRSRSPEYIDSASMKFQNFDRSLIGGMIINEYQLNPILLGFAVPQRTFSYLFGRPE